MTYLPNKKSLISTNNSSTSTLTNGSSFTGTADFNDFPGIQARIDL